MPESYNQKAGHESWPGLLDLPSATRSQRREGEGLAVAVSHVHLGQRLELYFANGGLIWGNFREISFILAGYHYLRQFMFIYVYMYSS